MGSGPSTLIRNESETSNHGNCHPCLPFTAPFARSNDPIGSPMPETPVHTRRKQHAVENAINKQDNQSSKYGGLEKEVVEIEHVNRNLAQIHEGKVGSFLAECEAKRVN